MLIECPSIDAVISGILFKKLSRLYKWLLVQSAYVLENKVSHKVAADNRVQQSEHDEIRTKLM